MNTGVLHIGDTGERDLPHILTKEEQRRAFRRARRHTLLVKAMRLALPAASLAIVGLYFLPSGKVALRNPLPAVSIEGIDLSRKGLKMMNPSYVGGDDKIGRYRIGAEYALQQIKAVHILDMHAIAARIDHPDRKWTELKATRGVYDTKTELMTLEGEIDISSDRGMAAKLRHADVNVKEQLIASDKPVNMSYGDNAISADTMRLWVRDKRVRFNGSVRLRLVGKTDSAIPGAGAGNGGNREPIDIGANTLEIIDAEKYALFTDAIEARQGKYTLTSRQLRVEYQGNIERAGAGTGAEGSSLKSIEAIDDVVIVSADDQRIVGQRAHYDAIGKTITVTGDVVFSQGDNELRGERLTVDMQTKHIHLDPATGDGKKAKRQRIGGTFLPKQSQGGDRRKAKPADDAPAAPGEMPLGGFSAFKMSESKEPVTVEADSLDVVDARQQAVFAGNVVVHQGKFEIISKQLVVNYTGGIGQAPGETSGKGAQTNVRSIEATGKVAISTPDKQTATSDRAIFDVAANTATIVGNVVLSQGGNIIHGDKLVVDLTTGLSRFDATASTASGDAANKRPRMSGVFMPGKLKEQAAQKKAATGAEGETGGGTGGADAGDAADAGTGTEAPTAAEARAPAPVVSTAPADAAPPLPWEIDDAMGGGN